MAKEKCDCGAMAVYCYMPGFGKGTNPHLCDACAHHPDDEGCSCNYHYANEVEGVDPNKPEGIEGKDWRWVKNDANDPIWISLDDKGRPYLCAEYMYDSEGFDKPTLLERIQWGFENQWLNFSFFTRKYI